MPGASLTIEAGTVVASTPTANGSGSIAVANGGRIYVLGEPDNPVIMTSTADVDTWDNGDPKTGEWREAANEWGNLTLIGNAYIGACTDGNEPFCDAGNEAAMEGLEDNPPITRYGAATMTTTAARFVTSRFAAAVACSASPTN
jgi:hypothetical protein